MWHQRGEYLFGRNFLHTDDIVGAAGKPMQWSGRAVVATEAGHVSVNDCRSGLRMGEQFSLRGTKQPNRREPEDTGEMQWTEQFTPTNAVAWSSSAKVPITLRLLVQSMVCGGAGSRRSQPKLSRLVPILIMTADVPARMRPVSSHHRCEGHSRTGQAGPGCNTTTGWRLD